jgi:hypothetical protein
VGKELSHNDYQPLDRRVLSRKFVELIGVTINASCTNLNPEGTWEVLSSWRKQARRLWMLPGSGERSV